MRLREAPLARQLVPCPRCMAADLVPMAREVTALFANPVLNPQGRCAACWAADKLVSVASLEWEAARRRVESDRQLAVRRPPGGAPVGLSRWPCGPAGDWPAYGAAQVWWHDFGALRPPLRVVRIVNPDFLLELDYRRIIT